MGGLVSAVILAKEGKNVCVLEKNNQYGGNLQTFARDKTIFDTGVHYIGGLDKGQNLYHLFKYLDILEDIQLEKMRSEEHTSELQSRGHLVCRLLLEKKKNI